MTADTPDRALTRDEAQRLVVHRPALEALSRYLESSDEVDTLAKAIKTGLPLTAKPQHSKPDEFGMVATPLLLNPALVAEHLATRTPPGERPPTFSELVYALNFMGTEHGSVRANVRTFTPFGEQNRPPYQRQGWWHLSAQVVERIKLRKYVPVLTASRGRPPGPRLDAQVVSAQTLARHGDQVRHLTTAPTRRLLVDFCRATELTCLHQRAVAEGLRLARRTPGNPAMQSRTRIHVESDGFVVSASSLAQYAQDAAPRLDLPRTGWTPQVARALLAQLARTHHPQVRFVAAFAAMDATPSGPQVPGDWFWVSRSWVGAPAADLEVLAAEFWAWREEVERVMREVQARRAAQLAEFEDEMFDKVQES